ncbi:MAG: type I-C CRISPR-associated protein Cas5c [Acidobacteriota bacterium]
MERVSYEVMTPSAARGVLDSILWKPEMRWHVKRIEVLKPIRYISLKRNEVQSALAPGAVSKWMKDPSEYRPQEAGAGSKEATPRTTLALRDVAYVIEAEPVVFDHSGDNTPRKYAAMLRRRVAKGRFFYAPCLGCREFAARFEEPSAADVPIEESRDLGLMLYDIAFDPKQKANRPAFFKARLERGVLDTRIESAIHDQALRKEVFKCSYRR